ncbi:MAG TPA: hypothetical protein PKW60_00350 [Candidatus Hydrogenedentes bacterium]|jgi:hypothetical protein|nr:hypothetical protein [Candidatus Hydrogenedentota bacterium]
MGFRDNDDIPVNRRAAAETERVRTPVTELRNAVLAPRAESSPPDWFPAIAISVLVSFMLLGVVALYSLRSQNGGPDAGQNAGSHTLRGIHTQRKPENRSLALPSAPNRRNDLPDLTSDKKRVERGASQITTDSTHTPWQEHKKQSVQQAGRKPESGPAQPDVTEQLDPQDSRQPEEQTSQRASIPTGEALVTPPGIAEQSGQREASLLQLDAPEQFGTHSASQPQQQIPQRTPIPASDAATTRHITLGQSQQRNAESQASQTRQRSEIAPPERPRADSRVPLLPLPQNFSKRRN